MPPTLGFFIFFLTTLIAECYNKVQIDIWTRYGAREGHANGAYLCAIWRSTLL